MCGLVSRKICVCQEQELICCQWANVNIAHCTQLFRCIGCHIMAHFMTMQYTDCHPRMWHQHLAWHRAQATSSLLSAKYGPACTQSMALVQLVRFLPSWTGNFGTVPTFMQQTLQTQWPCWIQKASAKPGALCTSCVCACYFGFLLRRSLGLPRCHSRWSSKSCSLVRRPWASKRSASLPCSLGAWADGAPSSWSESTTISFIIRIFCVHSSTKWK